MDWHDIMITLQTLLAFFGGITIVITGISAITKMFSPFKDLKRRVDEIEDRLKLGNKKFEMLENNSDEQLKIQKEICKSLLVIMKHSITGNSIDKIAEQYDELQRFLIDN